MLFVQSADGVKIANGKLTLVGVSTNTIFFSDSPARVAGHMTTKEFVPFWSEGTDSFSKDGSTIRDAVVVLRNPKLDGDRLTFDVQVLEGDLSGADGAAAVFIDIVGLPFTPLSYAGIARRTARRAAWYGAAVHPTTRHPPTIRRRPTPHRDRRAGFIRIRRATDWASRV